MLVHSISRLFSAEIPAENVHNAKLAQLGKRRAGVFSFLSSVFVQGALEMFATEVKARKVCLDDGFQWGGEDVRMGERFSEK